MCILQGLESLQRIAAALRETGAALSLQHDTHLSAGAAPLCGDGLKPLSSPQTSLILPGGEVCVCVCVCVCECVCVRMLKTGEKNCRSERRREKAKETRWAEGGRWDNFSSMGSKILPPVSPVLLFIFVKKRYRF